ncbi:MAG: Ldh family oxidoreductase [Gemmataceae bacterium]
MTHLSAERLHEFARRVFAAHGVPPADAAQAADVLLCADLRGIDSHGVVRLSAYAANLATGRFNPRPNITVLRRTPATARLDGDNGLGLVVGPWANALAAELAESAGTGWVSVGNSTHFGIAGYYVLECVKRGLIGWAMTNAANIVVAHGGAERVLGTNPIAVGVPAGNEHPVVIDLATSAAAYGKLDLARRRGEPIPDGWLIDSDGRPSREPAAFQAGGALLPLGGHKGYCLAALVDLLCGPLSGANWGPYVPPFLVPPLANAPSVGRGLGHLFGSMRVDAFIESDEFTRQVDAWVQRLRASRPAPDVAAVLIPGDPERRAETERRANGIPLPPTVIAELERTGREAGVPFA